MWADELWRQKLPLGRDRLIRLPHYLRRFLSRRAVVPARRYGLARRLGVVINFTVGIVIRVDGNEVTVSQLAPKLP